MKTFLIGASIIFSSLGFYYREYNFIILGVQTFMFVAVLGIANWLYEILIFVRQTRKKLNIILEQINEIEITKE